MVNNVNGSNPNLYVDPRNNNNGQPKFVTPPRQQGGYNTDGYAINMSNTNPVGPVPDVKVGFMDRMGLTFKDVMQTEENTKRFVAFQNAMKSNPQGYLQPGSKDVTATTDLQKKLKLMGYNITVNGSFGNATEQAVIKFKNSVGVNDGYLTKNGNQAVSGIVTPQTWAVLNASVASRLNPNSNLSGGNYVPPVTQKELSWAKELQNKIAQFGYRPSSQEKAKYEDIYNRQRVGMQSQEGVFDATKVAPPTQQEMDWAKDLLGKMQQFGYKPTQQERDKYQSIYQRIQMQKADNQHQAKLENPKAVTQADIDWAVGLMNKVSKGYNPTTAETKKYEQIYAAIQQGKVPQKKNEVEQTQPTQNTSPAKNTPPSKDELKWASDLEAKVSKGYNPTAQEKEKYTNIFERYKASATNPANNIPKLTTGKPTDAEITWAQNLQKKVNEQGYEPSQAEIDAYTNIANRLNASEETTDSEPVQDKPQKGTTSFTVEQFGTIGNAYNNWKAKHPDTSFPRDNVFYAKSNGQLVSQHQVNKASKSGGDYVSKLGLRNAPALYIPDLNGSQASGYKFLNGSIVASGGSDNSALVQKKTSNQSKSQTQPKKTQQVEDESDNSQQVISNAPTSNIPKSNIRDGVSRQELEWAEQLQVKVGQGYKPNQQELAAYEDIYNRYQNGKTLPDSYNPQQVSNNQNNTGNVQQNQNTQTVGIDPSNGDPELRWALDLLDKVQQGYQPNQNEIAKYEQVIARNQSVPATP